MFSLNINKTVLTLISVLLAIVIIVGIFYYQSSKIENYELKLQNAVTTQKVADKVRKVTSFEESQDIILNYSKGEIDEENFTTYPDGNYTISF